MINLKFAVLAWRYSENETRILRKTFNVHAHSKNQLKVRKV